MEVTSNPVTGPDEEYGRVDGDVIKVGAEAEIRRCIWMGREAVLKRRIVKGYRHPELDRALRAARTRHEARLMQWARQAGVRTPLIYDIDMVECSLVMDLVGGQRVKELLSTGPEDVRNMVLAAMGESVGRLHAADIVHGDLTTSNMIWGEDGLWLIDFSLGERTPEHEAKGVDLHLLAEAIKSAHSELDGALEKVLEAYTLIYAAGDPVIETMRSIEKRGRYR